MDESILLALIVSLIALGSVVLVGVLGYLADKSGEDEGGGPAEHKSERNDA